MAQDEKCLTTFMQRVDGYFKPVPNARMGETQFDVDFFELKQLSASLKQSTDEEYKSTEGYKADNRKKNRYKDIVPFDATRVKLSVKGDDPNTDYINASFIKGAENHSNYIASQGPLPHTILDFWQMLWQYNISVIVMVCREIELGKKKCERYWAAGGETKTFGAITVTSEKDEKLSEGYSLRVIKAVNGQETRYITQFHYTSWPDHGVPKTCYEILSLINHVREVQSYRHDVDQPLCVHCSAGCGRTGAVIVVDFVRNLLEKKIVPPNLKTFDIISNMRRQRPALVQTKEQYEFVNVAIAELFKVYIRTNTLERKDFSVGYQSEEYVNVNICSDSKSRLKDSHSSSGLSQYENFDVRTRANGTANAGSTDLNDIPPPKPSRPVSSLLLTSNPYANLNQKPDTSIPPSLQRRPTPSPKPRGNPQNGNTVNMSPVRSLPTMPSADAGKSRVPTAKPNIPKIVSPVESQEPPPGSQIGNSLQSYQKNNIYNEVDRTDQGRRSQSSPIPPTVPMKTWESHVFLDDAPPALPERTPDSYCVIDGGQSGVQAYESFDTTAISTVPIPENNEATRRHSAVATSGNVGVKNMMATVFDKTTTAFAKVGATISKTGDDTNTGVPTVTLEDRKPTYTQEPTVYNGQDMSFGRRLLKKVRGPRKQK